MILKANRRNLTHCMHAPSLLAMLNWIRPTRRLQLQDQVPNNSFRFLSPIDLCLIKWKRFLWLSQNFVIVLHRTLRILLLVQCREIPARFHRQQGHKNLYELLLTVARTGQPLWVNCTGYETRPSFPCIITSRDVRIAPEKTPLLE